MVSWTHRHLEHTFLDMELLIKSSQVLLSPTVLFTTKWPVILGLILCESDGTFRHYKSSWYFSSKSDGTFSLQSDRSFLDSFFASPTELLVIIKVPGTFSKSDGPFHYKSDRSF